MAKRHRPPLSEASKDRLEQLFQRYIELDPITECWVWTRSWDKDGYGIVVIQKHFYRTHRLTASLYLDYDLDSLERVWHACGCRACINPDHLRIGAMPQMRRRDHQGVFVGRDFHGGEKLRVCGTAQLSRHDHRR